MSSLHQFLPQKLFEVLIKANLSTPKQILILSVWDIKRLTNLHTDDIILIKNLIANFTKPQIITASLLIDVQKNTRLSTGCKEINLILDGGVRRGCITEIYGESGTGKTQLGIQAAVYNWPDYCIYICTEDLFPVKRFNIVKQSIPNYNSQIDYGKNVYIEHITESQDLLTCLKVKISKLLNEKNVSLIIIDSVAAPFRVEQTNYVQRAEDLRTLAIMLIGMAQDYNLAVICINQVTASFDNSIEALPSLGLAWSNMVSTRLHLTKTLYTINSGSLDNVTKLDHNMEYPVRELYVTFAPDLANAKTKFIITSNGIQGIS